MHTTYWSDSDVSFLVANYTSMPKDEIARILGRSAMSVGGKASRLGLKLDPGYIINHPFFDEWSSEMAYVLGFTIADGCINREQLKFALAEKDRALLEYIASKLVPGKEVKLRRMITNGVPHTAVALSFTSHRMNAQLAEFGVIPRKTGKESLPDCPPAFRADLLRGLFDGDGCVSHVKNKGLVRFNIASACLPFLEDVRCKLGFSYGCVYPKYYETGCHVWRVNTQKDIRAIADFMYYKGFPFCLERKRVRFYV